MKRRTKLLLAFGIPLGAILLAGAAVLLYARHKNAESLERRELVSQCRTYRRYVELLGPAVYDLKTDDEAELAFINNIFRGQRIWRETTNVNVAFWDGSGVPLRFIYAAYDRTDFRILETGSVQE